jgi:tetratricopeptide (TPR) repeat protein
VLTPAVAPAVARLCRLVDGLPLGIELAAAWVRTHEVTTILRQMEHGLDFLTTRLRDVPTRHRSLRSVVAESWDRLDPPAGAALAALSVFRDPFTSESAAAVAGTTPLDLSDLADRSLLQPTDSGQFALHGVIRQYASERLSADAGAAEEARARHAAYFTARTAALVAALRGVDQAAALRTLEAEIDDSRAAWEWAVEGRRWDLVASALDGLSLFFEMRGRLQEGEAAVARAATGLSAAIGDDAGAWSLLLGRLLGWQGRFTYFTGRYEPSADLFARGATLLRTLGAHRELAFILHMQSRLAEAQGDCTAAERLNREELASLRTANDLYGMSLALNHLGGLIFNRGDFIQARHFWQESVAVRRQIGDYHGVAHDLSNMGEAAVHLGDYDEARRRSEESLAVLREHGGGWRIIHALNTLGMVAWSQGQYDEARRLHDQCLIILNEIGDRRRAAEVLINLTHVERQCGDGAAAAARAAAALTIFREIGYRRGQAYCLASNGRLALDAGRHADARQHYGESLRLARLVDDQLAIGLAGAGLGAAWHGLGDDAAAWEQTTAGLRQLLDIGALPEALEVVVELAGAPEGTDDRAEWAVAVLTFAARHPCVRHHTREEAEHQVSRLASQIPVGVLAAARRRGEAMSIEAMWLTIVAAVDARRRPVALDR